MKQIGFIAIVAILLIINSVHAKDYEVIKKSGGLTVIINIDRNPPVVGDNTVSVTVKDSSDKIVTDADVKLEYSMPPMPGMPPMNYKAKISLSGNQYKTVMNLSMAGSWNIVTKIKRAGKTTSVKFTVDAR
jgi:hypothetical protein